MQNSILKNVLYSLIICVAITGLMVLSFQGAGDIAGFQFLVTYLTHVVLFWAAVIIFIVRVLRWWIKGGKFATYARSVTDPLRFSYIFLGVGNTWMGALAIVLHAMGKVNLLMVESFLPNLLVGVILLGNSIFSEIKGQTSQFP